MGYPIISVVFDEKKLATKTKEGLVQIRIYHEHKRKFISTNVKVCSDQWSSKTFVKGRSDAMALNNQINDILGRVRDCANECIKQSGEFYFEKFNELYNISSHSSDSFIEFIQERMYKRNIAKSTLAQHEVSLVKLKKFALIQTFKDLTTTNFAKFEDWMVQTGIKRSTTAVQMAVIKMYITEAYKLGYIDKDPTAYYKLERGKSAKREYLTKDELRKLSSLKLEGSYEVARDFFLFMCYTSLSYSDALKFDYERDVFEKGGKYMFRDTRKKTSEEYFIVLIPQAIELLKKHNYKFPKFYNGRINYLLRVIAEKIGLNKKLTCHIARHTAACLALNNGVRIEVVSRMLGHTKISTTQIYAKLITEEVEKAYDKIADVWGEIET